METWAQKLESPRNLAGVVGAIAWILSLQFHGFALNQGLTAVADASAGYTLGFAAAFSGWVAAQILHGNFAKLVDSHRVFKWLSIVALGCICLFGIIGGVLELCGDASNYFNVAFWFGGFIMAVCTAHVVKLIDGI